LDHPKLVKSPRRLLNSVLMTLKETIGFRKLTTPKLNHNHTLKMPQMMLSLALKQNKLKMLKIQITELSQLLNLSNNTALMMVSYTLHGEIIKKDISQMERVLTREELEESIITSNIELELKCMNQLMMLFQPVKRSKQKLQMMV